MDAGIKAAALALLEETKMERIRSTERAWLANNRELNRKSVRAWVAANPEKVRLRVRTWEKSENGRARSKRRSKSPEGICRKLLRRVLHDLGCKKDNRTHTLNGFSALDLRSRLEAMFRDGMAWDNWGSVWQLDHIREVALFIEEGITDPAVINALSNLQPLLIEEHRAKTTAFWKTRRAS